MDEQQIDRDLAITAADVRAKINKAIPEVFLELLEAGPQISLMFNRNNFQELRSIPDEQLKVAFRLARMGHACVCAGTMEGNFRMRRGELDEVLGGADEPE